MKNWWCEKKRKEKKKRKKKKRNEKKKEKERDSFSERKGEQLMGEEGEPNNKTTERSTESGTEKNKGTWKGINCGTSREYPVLEDKNGIREETGRGESRIDDILYYCAE